MTERDNQWQDKCTSLKPNDKQFERAQKLISKTGCYQQNKKLTECLIKHRKDWRQCKNQTALLNQCLKKQKN